MFFNRKIKFKVIHQGRGGIISYKYGGEECSLPIEMGAEGDFYISKPNGEKSDEVRSALRTWLNETDREGWLIDT